jgi:hypothetical protein
MFYRIKRAVAYWRFSRIAKGILDTPPIALRPAPIRVVSMLQARDMLMYLLAIKSFYARIPGGAIEVIDDGSLTANDRARLVEHIPGISIKPAAAIETHPCPRGGTWERLLHILDLSASTYVVQLDSDILTTGPIPEVNDAIARNLSFTLGSNPKYGIVSLEEAAALHDGADTSTQTVAERALPLLPDGMGRCYVRGCSGFAGFAVGASQRAVAETFSTKMEVVLGARWHEWGTEQVASNYLIANAPGGFVLPAERYATHYGHHNASDAALIHFIGTWRFRGGTYARFGRAEIARLAHLGRNTVAHAAV